MTNRAKFRWWMTSPVGAIKALRWNYRWPGVWVYLRTNHRRACRGGPGWWLVLRYPSFVVAQQLVLADGTTFLTLSAPGGHAICPACGGRCSGTPDHLCTRCGAQVCPREAP